MRESLEWASFPEPSWLKVVFIHKFPAAFAFASMYTISARIIRDK